MRKPSEDFIRLIKGLTGEVPKYFSESFNVHYVTSNSFIKLSRPWAAEWRVQNEITTALEMGVRGVPVPRPITEIAVPFTTAQGDNVKVSVWERLHPLRGTLTEEQWMMTGADWISKFFAMTPPSSAGKFGLHGFMDNARTRLRGLESDVDGYAGRIIAELDQAENSELAKREPRLGFIHGDMHPGNMMLTEEGLKIFDWESARVGPIEWDTAQNLRFAPEVSREEQTDWWVEQGADRRYLDFYYRVRSLTHLSFLVATRQHGARYDRNVRDLGWE